MRTEGAQLSSVKLSIAEPESKADSPAAQSQHKVPLSDGVKRSTRPGGDDVELLDGMQVLWGWCWGGLAAAWGIVKSSRRIVLFSLCMIMSTPVCRSSPISRAWRLCR